MALSSHLLSSAIGEEERRERLWYVPVSIQHPVAAPDSDRHGGGGFRMGSIGDIWVGCGVYKRGGLGVVLWVLYAIFVYMAVCEMEGS